MIDRSVIEHNVLVAVGPTDWLEVTAGLIHGGVRAGAHRGYSISGPIVQGKALIFPTHDGGWPGVAIAGGVLPPWGYGAFTPPGWGGFVYAPFTLSRFDEGLLVHANLGFAMGDGGASTSNLGVDVERSDLRTLFTYGVGTQVRLVAGLHGVAEIYHGDPYDPRTGFHAAQAGFRYIFNDNVQIDGTVGSSLTKVTSDGHSQVEQWGTLGLRLVTPELW